MFDSTTSGCCVFRTEGFARARNCYVSLPSSSSFSVPFRHASISQSVKFLADSWHTEFVADLALVTVANSRSMSWLDFTVTRGAMAFILDVTLFSGKRVSLEADPVATLESLNKRAQTALLESRRSDYLIMHLQAFWMEIRRCKQLGYESEIA